jgi:hypothetical protein
MIGKFTLRFLLFLSPFLVTVIICEFKLYELGETIPVDMVLTAQMAENSEIEFMRGIVSQDYNVYKMQGIRYHKPDLLVLGSSRVMMFRSFHFIDSTSFYNAGGILQCAADVEEFSKLICDGKLNLPKIIVIGIDPWWFKRDMDRTETWLDDYNLVDHAKLFSERPRTYFKLITNRDILNAPVIESENIGAYSKIKGSGFRKDGSKSIESEVIDGYLKNPKYIDRENPPIRDRIKQGLTNRFSPAIPDEKTLDRTIAALQKITKAGVKIVVYFPPFSTESMDLLNQSEKHFEWWNFIQQTAFPAFRIASDYIINTECPRDYNLKDDYFLDGFHPSEVFIGYQLQEHSKRSELLRQLINPEINTLNQQAHLPLEYYSE